MIDRVLDRLESGAPWLRRAAIALVLAAAIAVGSVYGLGAGLLALAGGVLLLAIALLWSSLQSLTGETALSLEEALHLAAPTVEEEQKRAVLRALKDLEFERGVGKISEDDYRELSARYRSEAKRLIQALDQGLGGRRERAERLLAKRLSAAGIPASDLPSTQPSPTGDAPAAKGAGASTTLVSRGVSASEAPVTDEPLVKRVHALDVGTQTLPSTPLDEDTAEAMRRGPTRRCSPCGTRNDLDARFCKSCGIAMAGPGERLCSACPATYAEDIDACPSCGVASGEPS